MKSLRLQIVTPEGRTFDGEALFIELPTLEGRLGIFPGHVPLVAGLAPGEIRVKTAAAAGNASFIVVGGHVEIEETVVTVLAFFASPEEEKLEEAFARAKAALEQAQDLPPEKMDDDLALLRVELQHGKKIRASRTSPIRR